MRLSLVMVVSITFCPIIGAKAAVVGVDGLIGSEWASTTPVSIGYDPAAAQSNFGTPGTKNHQIAYNIYFRSDDTYLYGAWQKNPAGGDAPGTSNDFVNIYFNSPDNSSGSFGVEVLNDRFFKPGVDGYYASGSNLIQAATGSGSDAMTLEFAIPLAYLLTDPNGLFSTNYQFGNRVRVSLSQGFGYSVVGGQSNYGDPRLGITTITPLPPALLFLASGLVGLAGLRRWRNRGTGEALSAQT